MSDSFGAAGLLSDVESALPAGAGESRGGARSVLRWRSGREAIPVSEPGEIRAGDTVVVPASGCFEMPAEKIEEVWGALAHFHSLADGRPLMDMAELSFAQARDLPLLRVSNLTMQPWASSELAARLRAHGERSEPPSGEETDELRDLLEAGRGAVQDTRFASILTAILDQWRAGDVAIHAHPGGGVVVKGRRRLGQGARPPAEETGTESEELDTSLATQVLPLDVHLADVEKRALDLASICGVPAELARALALAGKLHDIGKADVRFQVMLHRGDEWAASRVSAPLAKSPDVPLFGNAAKRIQERVGLPKGFRHELVSVRMAEASDEFIRSMGEHCDLVLHLVGSHHGYCRPFAPVVADDHPEEVRFSLDRIGIAASSATGLERIDSGVASRFWLLVRTYGWWGIAFLEAVVRLADHLESERREREPVSQDEAASERIA